MSRVITFPALTKVENGNEEVEVGLVEYFLDIIFRRSDLPEDEATADLVLWLVPYLKPLRGANQAGHRMTVSDDDHKLIQQLSHITLPILSLGAQVAQASIRKALFQAEKVREQTKPASANGAAAEA